MADFGIKISKAGYDVKTAPVEKCSLHSEHQNYIIRKSGYISQTVSGGNTASAAAGGTFYKDNMFLGFVEVDGNGKWYAPYVTETTSGGGVKLDIYIETDKTQVLTVDVSATSGTHSTKSYILLLFSKLW